MKKVLKASKHATGARVLTSDECAGSILEKKKKHGRLSESKRKKEREEAI